jgi:hypothetical protein
MNKEPPKSLIEAAFKNPKAKLSCGNILIPAKPLDTATPRRCGVFIEAGRYEKHASTVDACGINTSTK